MNELCLVPNPGPARRLRHSCLRAREYLRHTLDQGEAVETHAVLNSTSSLDIKRRLADMEIAPEYVSSSKTKRIKKLAPLGLSNAARHAALSCVRTLLNKLDAGIDAGDQPPQAALPSFSSPLATSQSYGGELRGPASIGVVERICSELFAYLKRINLDGSDILTREGELLKVPDHERQLPKISCALLQPLSHAPSSNEETSSGHFVDWEADGEGKGSETAVKNNRGEIEQFFASANLCWVSELLTSAMEKPNTNGSGDDVSEDRGGKLSSPTVSVVRPVGESSGMLPVNTKESPCCPPFKRRIRLREEQENLYSPQLIPRDLEKHMMTPEPLMLPRTPLGAAAVKEMTDSSPVSTPDEGSSLTLNNGTSDTTTASTTSSAARCSVEKDLFWALTEAPVGLVERIPPDPPDTRPADPTTLGTVNQQLLAILYGCEARNDPVMVGQDLRRPAKEEDLGPADGEEAAIEDSRTLEEALWCRRPGITEASLLDLCDISHLERREKTRKLMEKYRSNISFALGEGGRELLRACLNAKGCKGRRLQGASVPVLLRLAHDWDLWNVALRIKVERMTGDFCPKHRAFINFKAMQSHLRKFLRREQMCTVRDDTGVITDIHFEELKSLTLGKEGREKLRSQLRKFHERDPARMDALLDRYGFKYSELRNATVPQLLKMAHVCSMWGDVIDACKQQEAKRDFRTLSRRTSSRRSGRPPRCRSLSAKRTSRDTVDVKGRLKQEIDEASIMDEENLTVSEAEISSSPNSKDREYVAADVPPTFRAHEDILPLRPSPLTRKNEPHDARS